MPNKKPIDYQALMKMVLDGADQREIMEAFGFSNSAQLKEAYAEAMSDGRSKSAPRKRTPSSGRTTEGIPTVTVNRKGTLIIPKALLEEEFKAGDKFDVAKTDVGMVLWKS
jgi:hypothetical protein